MSYKLDFTNSTTAMNLFPSLTNGFPVISPTNLSFSFNDASGNIDLVDGFFGVLWQLSYPGANSTTPLGVAALGDVPLLDVRGILSFSSGDINILIDGIVTSANGTHPDLTLNTLLTQTWPEFLAGHDRIKMGQFSDSISGLDGNDRIFGLNGDDLLKGGTGKDYLSGGRGHDTLYGEAGNDRIEGDAGNDIIQGNGGKDSINGGSGHDAISGADGNDFIKGAGGRDLLGGNGGDDTLRGGGGADSLLGGAGNDLLYAEGGNDTIAAGAGKDLVQGGGGSDHIAGDGGNDMLQGGTGHDDLQGGNGNDTLFGGGGDDVLNGGSGRNLLVGSAGTDTFVFDTESYTTTIRDFDVLLETLSIPGITALADFSAVTDFSGGVQLEVTADSTIILLGYSAADLASADIWGS